MKTKNERLVKNLGLEAKRYSIVMFNRGSKYDVTQALLSVGFKQIVDSTGGDQDFIVADNNRKEFIFWEDGFGPCVDDMNSYGVDSDLSYFDRNRD